YSSIFIASPLLAQMKEREPRYATIRQRLANRAERELLTPRAAALAGATAGGASRGRARSGRPAAGRPGEVLRPGAGARRAAPSGATPGPSGDAGDGTGGGTGSPAAGARGGTGQRPASASGARRPPPRPRKGGGKGRRGGRRR
ncbi:MAG TPA: hypothetical protein DCQ30_13945, partial [Acidimicrobiaceae bacterium]|nr:hypothetical protein [Acidimicrobiaceae bacterium]